MGTLTYLPQPLLSPELRKRVEQTIDWLVGLLDAVEAPGVDMEPSLAALALVPGDFYVSDGRCFDVPCDQSHWAAGAHDDREGDLADTADDREHDECDRGEPWLGAIETTCEAIPQTTDSQEYTWSLLGGVSFGHDYEHDPAECGIADADGLNEQFALASGFAVRHVLA